MRKVRLAVAAIALALVMAMPVAVAASATDDTFIRVEDGVAYVPLRLVAYHLGAAVEWDSANRAAHIIRYDGEVLVVAIEAVGGFIEDGVSWIPIEFADITLMEFLHTVYVTERVGRIDLTLWDADRFADVREPMFSTDLPHGVIAVGYIEYMSDNIGARSPFTYRELEAAVWIVEELLAMGHDWYSITVQEFTYWDITDAGIGGLMMLNWDMVTSPFILGEGREYQLRPDRVSQNVVLTLPGQTERKIVVGAHYDSPPYPSASDNASGTALLLESAQRMLETEHYYTIVYVFFGAEEVGLVGAYFYYESLTPRERDNIVMMVNADVIIEGPYIIYGAGSAPILDEYLMAELLADFMEAAMDILVSQFEALVADFYEMGVEDLSVVLPFYSLEGFVEFVAADMAASPEILLMQASMLGIVEPVIDAVAQQVTDIAAGLTATHDFELISIPLAIGGSSDNLVFLFAGHTVVNLIGLERVENIDDELAAQLFMVVDMFDGFTVTVLHTPLDEFHTIEALWPGMMNANLEAFVLFLEAILTGSFS